MNYICLLKLCFSSEKKGIVFVQLAVQKIGQHEILCKTERKTRECENGHLEQTLGSSDTVALQ